MVYTNVPQRIYRRHEIPIADYLMSFQHALEDEFLGPYSSLKEAAQFVDTTLGHRKDIHKDDIDHLVQRTDSTPNLKMWRASKLKHEHRARGQYFKQTNPAIVKKYPTAMKIIDEYGDDCPIANYSLLGPFSKINRHTGIENRSGEFIRMHIPLIIPKGEVFFEVLGETTTWDDIFGFNNQFVHSAHNNTPEWRLCFIIDIKRTRAGLPPGVPFEEIKHLNVFHPNFGGVGPNDIGSY